MMTGIRKLAPARAVMAQAVLLPVLLAVLLAASPAAPLAAGEAGTGGVWLKTDLSQRFELRRNADLVPGGAGTTARSDTRLGLTLSSETRSDRLALTLNSSLRHVTAPDAGDDLAFGLRDLGAALEYGHDVGHARFNAGASVRIDDISDLAPLTRLSVDDNGDGVIEIDDALATGRRRTIGAEASLRFGIDGPAEIGLSVGSIATDHFDTGTTSSHTDSRSHRLRGSLALQLAPDLRLSSALAFRRFEQDGGPRRDTWSLDNRLVRGLARGDLSASLSLTRVEEGTRTSLGLGWSQPLPDGRIAVTLGATRAAGGQSALTGRLSWRRTLPSGGISASVAQGFAANADDAETRFTHARIDWSHDLTALTRLDLGLAHLRNVTGGTSTTRAEFSAGIRHMLNEDWTLDAGYRRIGRNGAGRAQSDSLYLSVGRSFATRF